MIRVSFQIPSIGESSLLEVVRSVREQDFGDSEIVVSLTTRNKQFVELVRQRVDRLVEVPAHYGLLRARFDAFASSRGEFSFLLDATRPLLPGCMEALDPLLDSYDMIVIRELSRGSGLWARAARVDKEVATSSINLAASLASKSGVVLPRVFRSGLLRQAFSELSSEMTPHTFDRIVHGDHHLVYLAARNHSSNVGVADRPGILHGEDEGVVSIVRKYYRYGRSNKLLSSVRAYPQLVGLATRWRSPAGRSFTDLIELFALYALRSASFFMGDSVSKFSTED